MKTEPKRIVERILKTIVIFIAAVFSFLILGTVSAEQVANFSDCDVCPGAIYLPPKEANPILGEKIFEHFSKIHRGKVVKIDLDSVLKSGSGASLDDGYELRIWKNGNLALIRDLRDNSLIQLVITGTASKPQAEIYLNASKDQEIDLSDSIDLAWMKFRFTNIYQWVGPEKDKAYRSYLFYCRKRRY